MARARDGQTLVIVPEVKDNETVGLTLLHADFEPFLAADAAAVCCRGTRVATAR